MSNTYQMPENIWQLVAKLKSSNIPQSKNYIPVSEVEKMKQNRKAVENQNNEDIINSMKLWQEHQRMQNEMKRSEEIQNFQ